MDLPKLERPPLRVSRPVAACMRCRMTKVKCDGKLPACTACERAGKENECESASDKYAKGKERSYVSALELRLEKLSKRLAEVQRRRASTTLGVEINALTVSQATASAATQASQNRSGSRQEQRKEASTVDDLVADFGFLSVNATSRDFHTFSQSVSYPRLLLAVASAAPMPEFTQNPLPSRAGGTPLIQHYLDNIFRLLPFTSETTIFTSVDRVYENGGVHASAYDHWILRMILAIGAASRSKTRCDSHYAMALHHASAALRFADIVLHPGSIIGIQALLLLVEYSMLDPEHFKSWYLIGMAARAMVDLGLHQDPTEPAHIDKVTLDLRRRIFYCVYCLDRYISMAHSRGFSFEDDTTNVQRPRDTNFSSFDVTKRSQLFLRSLNPASYLYDIRQLQSQWYQDLHQSTLIPKGNLEQDVWSLCQSAASWYRGIPEGLPEPLMMLFLIELYYTYIFACAPSCRNPSISEYNKVFIFEYSVLFAEQLNVITQDSHVYAFLTYFEVLRAYFVGKLVLEILHDSYDTILSSSIPESLSHSPGAVARPELPIENRQHNPARAIDCITKLMAFMEYGHHRWGNSTPNLRDAFSRESALMLGRLKLKESQEALISDRSIVQLPATTATAATNLVSQSQEQPSQHYVQHYGQNYPPFTIDPVQRIQPIPLGQTTATQWSGQHNRQTHGLFQYPLTPQLGWGNINTSSGPGHRPAN